MAVETLQNSSNFADVPYEIIYGLARKLSSTDLLAFRAVCQGFKQLIDAFKLEPFNIWKRYIPPAFVLKPECSKAAEGLLEAVKKGNEAYNEYLRASKKSKKFGNKKERKALLLDTEKTFEDQKRIISKAVGEFTKVFHACLSDLKLSPSEVTEGNGWIALQNCFVFLYHWLQKLPPADMAQEPFVKDSLDMAYTGTIRRVFSAMVDEFANSMDGNYPSQVRCLLGRKEYEEMLNERRYQNKGGSFEKL